VHWIYGDTGRWLRRQRDGGLAVIGVELTDESPRLADLPAAQRRTVIVLGNASTGIPAEALEVLDTAVEIPMIGTGVSLNVAVAGSWLSTPGRDRRQIDSVALRIRCHGPGWTPLPHRQSARPISSRDVARNQRQPSSVGGLRPRMQMSRHYTAKV
jgi:hypothetical protein